LAWCLMWANPFDCAIPFTFFHLSSIVCDC
jgi:hypothetical protein